jgi:hypothetical protein
MGQNSRLPRMNAIENNSDSNFMGDLAYNIGQK